MIASNFFTIISDCVTDQLVDLFLSIPRNSTPATVGHSNNLKYNFSSRITNCINLPEEIILNTKDSIKNLYNNFLIHTFKQSIKSIETPQFLYYTLGGKYEEHNDSEDYVNNKIQRVCERDVTIILYLNDNYEGGELEFVNYGLTVKPKAKTLLAFPSYIEFTHKVHPVKKGERFAIVTWINTYERIYRRPYQ